MVTIERNSFRVLPVMYEHALVHGNLVRIDDVADELRMSQGEVLSAWRFLILKGLIIPDLNDRFARISADGIDALEGMRNSGRRALSLTKLTEIANFVAALIKLVRSLLPF